ncbi:creatininase family protein [Frankia sp. CNm7]|uniref:Creatininase family protein n=1 Tax=Frankia nepalensis TaxID=1836974 RepID=A0A937RLG8_9ACTN|nr:creatininase family protein [Frankia nepalensis]MBL7500097.1 creatininase family protein [Frankia nepalensis]MBL7512446.1 creatininase family protein [Frankia nepalensis]MBL7523751.1 creatininase family protein [Frankia nepalensis]MBL7628583.1 creatininase family protein [Frankia nepalensis]
MTRIYADLRAPEIGELSAGAVAVLPIGSVEQHGPHLPLSTDLIVADTLARDVVAAHGDEIDLLLLPTLAYSKSNEHAWSAGTMWLSAATVLAMLDDLGRCLATTPVERLVFLNGHGGNSALLQVASRDIRLAHGLRTFVMHPSLPPDHGGSSPASELGMGIHAGLEETSLMLHLRPDLVRMDLAERSVPEHLASFERVGWGRPVSFGWLSDDFGTNGTLGDPTGATAERGKTRYEAMVETAAASLREIARFDPKTAR